MKHSQANVITWSGVSKQIQYNGKNKKVHLDQPIKKSNQNCSQISNPNGITKIDMVSQIHHTSATLPKNNPFPEKPLKAFRLASKSTLTSWEMAV
ncbi:unnamed protein product [Sphenostylis stenocarpa]|uniref:Uncharacterized protein n=1 Tax=Sphenostylis stenocarpa TaxID=92480 RepID=A0AA86VAY0_9FABA|nr:unnamed protein product [Sphenostylis stenocarpa]